MNVQICKSNKEYSAYKVDYNDLAFKEFVKGLIYFRFENGILQYDFDEFVGWVNVADGSYIVSGGESNDFYPVSKEKFEKNYTVVNELPWTGWVHVY